MAAGGSYAAGGSVGRPWLSRRVAGSGGARCLQSGPTRRTAAAGGSDGRTGREGTSLQRPIAPEIAPVGVLCLTLGQRAQAKEWPVGGRCACPSPRSVLLHAGPISGQGLSSTACERV